MEFNAIYVIVAREVKKFVRERSRLVSAIARPLVWLFLVGAGMSRLVPPVDGVSYMQFIFPGILGMTILFSAMFSSISIIWDKEFGFMKEILVAPVSRISIVVGKALSGMIISTIQAVIVLALFPLLGLKLGAADIIGAVIICALVSFSVSAFGIVIATFYESYESFSAIMNFIIMPMFFLSGAMYPVKLLPEALRFAAKLNPLTYGVDALKHVISPLAHGPMSPDFSIVTDLAVIIVLSVIFVFAGAKAFERRG
ncbi:MAG: ABC transporter permease [Thermodesulfovibrionales bacterium]|nr:ABC transporter permease [Nitrospinota bacterium]MCG2709654.1 ABC transporter permease [Thermodesulfovibrionales bacterium]